MVRGCQKKIVYLKNTGSEVFDEAYFLVRDDASTSVCECDMIKEANRILDECIAIEERCGKGQLIIDFIKRTALPFLCGAALGIIVAILIK